MLLSHLDKELLSFEVLKKFGIAPAKSEPVNPEGYKDRTCIRTYNPSTFGPLDQFAPLRTFEEEVMMDSSDAGNAEILENLKGALGFFPRSPPP
ncbi:hypothetical protein OESDEN_09912 [Oesophagostomum dentatum]|uniref:Uncharacterized protein n=1 Tax=Oesophagostomum dentatum TaxID=61180 RepID=A0A0B1T4D3_OESDE|nr:hypothetical protein OESDEN_09912 [Oesophagostomum dentatum]